MQEKIRTARAPVHVLRKSIAAIEKQEVSHQEIYDRLMAVEKKVDNIESNTEGMVAAFKAAQGAFTVLEFMAKVAKPILVVCAFMAAVAAALTHIKFK